MSVLCGWGSIDERGKASGGRAGDQTGREVKTGPWYQFGQTVVLRAEDRAIGKKMALIMRKLCNNDHVGYDQGQRTTLWKEMSKVDWNPDKLTTNCETDCSALVAVVCKCAGFNVSPDLWTGNMKGALLKTKKFKALSGSNYTATDKNLLAGDIILNPERHVIMALEDGPSAGKASTTKESVVKEGQRGLNSLVGAELAIDGNRGPATKKVGVEALQYGLNRSYRCGLEVDGAYGPATKGAVKQHPAHEGMTGYYIRAIQCLLYVNGYNAGGIDGSFGPKMDAAVRSYQKDKGLEVDGYVGPKTMLRLVS